MKPARKLSTIRWIFRALVAVLLASRLTPASHAQTKELYKDTSLPIAKRVDDLISRMTLEEKVLQMESSAPEITRLGVPAYNWWSEALHGVARSGYASVFPQAIAMAATWDEKLVYQEGETIGIEGRAKYNEAIRDGNHNIFYGLDFWSPNINIFRDPRWGRGQETYGEDPFLTSKLGVAFVTGVQGNDPKYFRAIATPKHYAVHSGPDPERHRFNVDVSKHDFEDTYLPAFRATIVDGRADSIMCAYNAVDGVPACASKMLLQETLRDAWKFQGYVTSDCGGVGDIAEGHKYAPDNAHGAALAVLAGTDTTCGHEYISLVKAVQDGLITENEIDVSLKRLFTARFRLGMFDPPDAVPFNRIPFSQNDSPQHHDLTLRAAREAMVLLKNEDSILPLKPDTRAIAVIGPNAESLDTLEGNYNGVPSRPIYPLDGIRTLYAGKTKVLYAQGAPFLAQLPVPVPSTVFMLSGKADTRGIKGEYFANTDFSGKPVLTRVDPRIQFDWNAGTPAPGVPVKAFAVRWTGTLSPPGPGDYTFGVSKPDCWPCQDKEKFRVYLDGRVVLDTVEGEYVKQDEPANFIAHFADETPHEFRLEYVHQSPLWAAGVTLTWQPPAGVLRTEAMKIAGQADVVVAFVGLSPDLEGEEMSIHVPGFSGGDRTDIGLPEAQQQLLEALASTGKPLVVVLMSGSAVALNWAQEHAAAVLEAWYPGEEGGRAIAETLAGLNNPAGRLPVTFYSSLDQLPPFEDYSMQNRTYRYFQGKPLYGFGYGLSYSKFEYSNLKASTPHIKAGDDLTVEVDVRNTFGPEGSEVAELYLEFPSTPGAPARALRGFKRVRLAAGESRHITFTLKPRDLSMVNDQGEHLIAPGEYNIFVGGAQPAEASGGLRIKFDIAGEQKLPR